MQTQHKPAFWLAYTLRGKHCAKCFPSLDAARKAADVLENWPGAYDVRLLSASEIKQLRLEEVA